MDYLQRHKDTLIPEFRQVWEAAGFKTSGTWEEVFGKLFIPETGGGPSSAPRALYAFGRHDAIGFSPFGIDRPDRLNNSPDLTGVYDLLSRAAPLILAHQGDGTMTAVMLGPKDPPQKVQLGNYTLQATYWPIRYTMPLLMPGEPPAGAQPPAAAIFIAAGPDEFYAIGSGVKVTFAPNTPGPPFAGLGTVEAGTFVDGRWVPDIRLAGDDTGQGEDLFELQRNLGIQRFTLYRYR
jgi:hypothetical protein